MDYMGKVAFITGGSTGIGRAVGAELVRRGASVLLIARNEEKLKAAQAELIPYAKQPNQKIEVLPLDVADFAEVSRAIPLQMQKLGVPDLSINCAGFAYPAHFEDIPYEKFRQMLDTNVGGVWNVLQAVLPEMKKRGSGEIAAVSSIVGFMSFVGYSGYSVTKFGLCGLFEALRNELKPFGIRAHVLFAPDTNTPGFIEENKTKPHETHVVSGKSRLYSPEEVGKIFLKGLAKKRLYIVVGFGAVIHFLFRHFPWLVRAVTDSDHAKARKQVAAGKT